MITLKYTYNMCEGEILLDMFEKTLSSDYKFKGRIFRARVDEVELPDGSLSKREIVEHNGGVSVLAVTADGRVPLVRQYRHPYGEIIYEIPAGKLEKDEEPLQCGKRELYEETGFSADKWQSLGIVYPTPGYCAEKIYIFMATDLCAGDSKPDEGEFLECDLIPLDRAVDMVMSGEIKDSKSQIALLKAAKLLKEVQ